MKFVVLGLGVLSLTGCSTAGYVAGRIARIPIDMITYDEQGTAQPIDLEHGELGER